MADQIFNVESGFYDAINSDRVYSAEDMTRPYSRIVADGVFATNAGTPSDDLQVVSAESGMQISVLQGQAMVAGKWFDNPSAIVITVPRNTMAYARIDSVIMQIDKTAAKRVGSIVYRTGTASMNPQPPALSTKASVVEMRLANVRVAPNVRQISNSVITDLRGSAECPWVSGVVVQVDTSTLFAQYQAAYQEFYEQSTADFDAYVEQQRESWDAFVTQLTGDLEVTPNVLTYTSTYTASGAVTNIPISIASYDPNTDDLQVFINGIYAPKTVRWTLNANNTSITLKNAIAAGDVVNFVVFKSLVTGKLQSVAALLKSIDSKLAVLNYSYGTPLAASLKADMTDTTKIYVYTGSESGMTAGNWYFWDGSEWQSGGIYNAVAVSTDTSLTVAGAAADAKATGDKIDETVDELTEIANTSKYEALITENKNFYSAFFHAGGDGVPPKKLNVEFAVRQGGSGTPAPTNKRPLFGVDGTVVRLAPAAKNLLHNPGEKTVTQDGVTAVFNADGTVTVTTPSDFAPGADVVIDYEAAVDTLFIPTGPRLYIRNITAASGSANLRFRVARSYTSGSLEPTGTVVTGDDYAVFSILPAATTASFLQIVVPADAAGISETFAPIIIAEDAIPFGMAITDFTTFFPYAGHDVEIELSDTVYAGTLDVVSGHMKVTGVVVTLDGSETGWTRPTQNNPNGTLFRINVTDAGAPGSFETYSGGMANFKGLCDSFAVSSTGGNNTSGEYTFWYGTGGGALSFIWGDPSSGSTTAQWKAFLSESPVQVYAPLDVPVEYDLAVTGVAEVDGANVIWASAPNSIIDISFRYDTKLYVEQTQAMIGSVEHPVAENDTRASRAYAAGELIIIENVLYRTTDSIAKGNTIERSVQRVMLSDILRGL